ncbi:MAG: hypothetical protein DYG98_18360 [Haliscomenobacteraceae bacterium CHB4]|nr:hypothetical protein [Haliscomenobacteraceae bacterium CHB4]
MKKSSENDELPIFPLLEIFGGALGVLLLFIFVLLIQQERIKRQQKDPKNIGGITQMKMDNKNTGYVVSCFEDMLRIEETKEEIPLSELQKSQNRFVEYAKEKYILNKEKVICAFVYPNSNDVVMRIEKILIHMPEAEKYNFLVINDEIMEKLYEINEKNIGK